MGAINRRFKERTMFTPRVIYLGLAHPANHSEPAVIAVEATEPPVRPQVVDRPVESGLDRERGSEDRSSAA